MMFRTFKIACVCLSIFVSKSNYEVQYINVEKHSLTIEIEGIISHKGTLYIALYNSTENFLKQPYRKQSYSSPNFPRKITFTNLPIGEYAITIYQDLNNNNKLDKIFSVPIEPYGVSNNVISLPKFKNSKIKLIKNTNIKIKLKN